MNKSRSNLSKNQKSKNCSATYRPLLGHAKLESTVHYLGVEVEDPLEVSEQMEV